MSNFTIRMVTNDDEAPVSTLLKASYPELMRAHYTPEALELTLPLMTKANLNLLQSGTYYVAEAADQSVVGCGGWTMERPGTNEVAKGLEHLRHFATHPDCTGKGIGRAIYDICEEDAKISGIDRLQCYASLNAEPFYKALGFEPIEIIEVQLRSGLMFGFMLMMRGN